MEEFKQLISDEIQAIKNIPMDGSIEKAVELIHGAVHQKGGKVVVSGVGKAGHIGIQLSTTFCSTGTPSCFLSPLEAQHGDLGILQQNDIFFLISNSGMTREILELVELGKNLNPDIRIIVLTRTKESKLARKADVVILTGDTKEVCPIGFTPTTSITVMSVIVDLLVVALMKKIDFTKEMYSLRHHSGYLGSKSKS